MPAKSIEQIDADVGARIRARRKLLGLSQNDLAIGLGISFQQVQKYEKGRNRLGSSRLQSFARLLGTTPAALFGESRPRGTSVAEIKDIERFVMSPEGTALNKSFARISDQSVRRAIISMLQSLTAEA